MSMRWGLYAIAWALAMTSISLVSVLDVTAMRWSADWLAPAIISPLITAFTVLGACAASTSLAPRGVTRAWARAVWVAGALMLDAAITPWLLYDVLGLHNWIQEVQHLRGEVAGTPTWSFLGDWLGAMTLSALAIGLAQRWQRRGLEQQALALAAARRDALRHTLLQTRFAVMQAHVEPEFLFNTLRDVDQLYGVAPQRAAALIDALIAYLRLALPGLRADGQTSLSTLGAEIDLVAAWLVVMRLRRAAPVLEIQMAPGLRPTPFSPMLLLPLTQSLVRVAASASSTITLQAEWTVDNGVPWLRLCLTHGVDGADFSIDAGVRERLATLYAERASLTLLTRSPLCVEMRIPMHAEGPPHADRSDC